MIVLETWINDHTIRIERAGVITFRQPCTFPFVGGHNTGSDSGANYFNTSVQSGNTPTRVFPSISHLLVHLNVTHWTFKSSHSENSGANSIAYRGSSRVFKNLRGFLISPAGDADASKPRAVGRNQSSSIVGRHVFLMGPY